MKHESIIPYVKEALTQPTPNPKYDLWQHTKSGQIYGYHWKDIDSAFKEQLCPGWYYMVQSRGDESFVHESAIELSSIN